MASYDLQVGAVGAVITVTCTSGGAALDVTGATTLQVVMLSPAGVRNAATAVVVGDGADGVISYTTEAGDIYMPGTWKAQAYAVLAGGDEFYSSVTTFTVGPNL